MNDDENTITENGISLFERNDKPSKTKISKNHIIKFTNNSNKMFVARIINRAGKETRKHRMCCNKARQPLAGMLTHQLI